MSKHLDILLLTALPASGKSEARTYLASLSPEECHEHFGIGHTVQLDDFPYVHIMRLVSDEMTVRGHSGPYFRSSALPFREPLDWGTLIELMNEDYRDLVEKNQPKPDSAALYMFDRLDRARAVVGAPTVFADMDPALKNEIAGALEDECRDLLDKKNAEHPDTLEGKTVVIEFARGGADGSAMPLVEPYGYGYSFAQLCPEILDKASILYIWVTPEESRRKNLHRTDPDDPGSILNHGVPAAVMYGDYGCDDMQWQLDNSGKPNTVKVERDGQTWNLPLGRFDNRQDLTTFIRDDLGDWKPADMAKLRAGMEDAFQKLHAARGL